MPENETETGYSFLISRAGTEYLIRHSRLPETCSYEHAVLLIFQMWTDLVRLATFQIVRPLPEGNAQSDSEIVYSVQIKKGIVKQELSRGPETKLEAALLSNQLLMDAIFLSQKTFLALALPGNGKTPLGEVPFEERVLQ